MARRVDARWLRTRSRRERALAAGASLLVVGIVAALAWAVWPDEEPAPPRARQYLGFTACLLTDDKGVGGPAAAPVWAGMQDASLQTRAKVQFLEVAGPQTADNALPFLAGLAQGRCDLVLATGTAPSEAVRRAAGRFPRTRFYTVGGSSTAGNVAVIPAAPPPAIRSAVDRELTSQVKESAGS